jgi:hypothetical protein
MQHWDLTGCADLEEFEFEQSDLGRPDLALPADKKADPGLPPSVPSYAL